MGRVTKKYNLKLLNYISFFEKVTHAEVKDCIEDEDKLIFIVMPMHLRRALGKNGSNIKQLNNELHKKIKVVEYSDDIKEFIKSLIMPLKVDDIEEDGKVIKLKSDDRRTKGLLIGKNAHNLREYEAIVKRYFDIDEIKVE